MNRKWFVLALIVLSGVARADLNFTFVDGATVATRGTIEANPNLTIA